jgi:hypothetical protein
VDEHRPWVIVGFAGLGLMAVAVFLPLWDEASTTFLRVTGNSLLQSGYGWATLVVVAISAASLFRIYQRGQRAWWPGVGGALVVVQAFVIGTSEDTMTLCAQSETGTVLDQSCQVADPGLGVYAAGVGGALLALAGLFIARLPAPAKPEPAPEIAQPGLQRRCPHCSEEMPIHASVCSHCNHSSEPLTAGS